ncbi:hypothetical protein KW542_21405 [Vibrio fluvialis]|nr:hypothetical protein [Vibrio fluvialis]MBY8250881.1 hypothetical protein [Vibrio fluvialis]MBY8281885.1 hypothetical protein [Vibrio fluvialis]
MSHQESNESFPFDEELETTSNGLIISQCAKVLLSAFSVLVMSGCVYLVYRYAEAPETFASPKELGVSSVFLFFTSLLILIWVPWEKLGLKVTKIGGIEFKEIVAGQASENAEEFGYLENRIEFLEQKVHSMNEIDQFMESFHNPDLRNLLLEFLTKYKKWSFSPSRIITWGSQQQGFSTLSSYEHRRVRSELQSMLTENLVETRLSKKGNTLYRIAKP